MADLIDSCLAEAALAHKNDGREFMCARPGKEYKAALQRLFTATRYPEQSEKTVETVLVDLRKCNRVGWEVTDDAGEGRQELGERLGRMLFTFKMRPTIFVRWLAVKSVYLCRTGPLGLTPAMRKWHPDYQIALLADIAGSIHELLIRDSHARRARWQQTYDKKLETELEKAHLLEKYQIYRARSDAEESGHARYVELDRKYSSQRELLSVLKELGLTDEEETTFKTAYNKLGYALVRAEFGFRYAKVFEQFDRGLTATRQAFQEYRRLRNEALEVHFVPPKHITGKIWKEITQAEHKTMYGLNGEGIRLDRGADWLGIESADPEWFDACTKGISEALRLNKKLAIDWLLRSPTEIKPVLLELTTHNISALDELENFIKRGHFWENGVSSDSRLEPAIKRAVETEQQLLRAFLEITGATSPWTRTLAHTHCPQWRERRQNQEFCSDFLSILPDAIKEL